MGTTLDNGIYLPDEGERNCYEGLAGNWVALDNHLGSTNIHVTINDKQAWNGHVADSVKHVTAADKQAWDGHVADSVKHVTAEDKAKWDAVTSKADDSDVVHKSGDETINGNKTFSSNINVYNSDSSTDTANIVLKNSKAERGAEFSEQSINFVDKNNNPLAKINCYGSGGSYTRLYITAYGTNNNSEGFYIRKTSTGTSILPTTAAAVRIGNDTFPYLNVQTRRVNDLEPGSLSLPRDRSARIDISSYFTNTGTGQSNSYTVPANGYIYLTLSELTNVHCFSRTSGDVTNYAQTFTKLNNSTGALYVLFPVRKNDVFVTTWYTTTTVSVDGAYFIPCQGNV